MGLPDQAALPGSGYRGCWYGNQSGDPKTVEQISTVTAVAADLQKTESWWAVICRGPCLGLDRWFPVPDPSGRSSVVRSGGGAVINPFKYQFLHW